MSVSNPTDTSNFEKRIQDLEAEVLTLRAYLFGSQRINDDNTIVTLFDESGVVVEQFPFQGLGKSLRPARKIGV
jgi:hypothetical protein